MTTCSVRWRPSRGRGEYEYVPAGILEDRDIHVLFDPLQITIPAEVRGVSAQGKPRLRKAEKNNRQKLHLPSLVVAVARVPEPRRQDIAHQAIFPLENKNYLIDAIDFDIIDDDGERVILSPLRMKILHSDFAIDLEDRLEAVARDFSNVQTLAARHAPLAAAIAGHVNEIRKGVNSAAIRGWADRVIKLQGQTFGPSNFGSITSLVQATAKPMSETEEDFYGTEGRTLIRVHAYKERDRSLVSTAKKHYRTKWGGKLRCESCGLIPIDRYGERGESCIEAHHKTPISQLLPDSRTSVRDLAMLCASCHRIVHSTKPILDIEDVLPKESPN